MDNLNFNIYGLTKPTTAAEISNLLIEALRVSEELDGQITAMEEFLELRACQAA